MTDEQRSVTPEQQCIHRGGCPKPDVCRQVGHCTSMTESDLQNRGSQGAGETTPVTEPVRRSASLTSNQRGEWVMTSWITTNRTAPPLEVKSRWVRAEWADAEIERLRAALVRYGHHTHPNCHDLTLKGDGSFGPRNGCLCGFDTAKGEGLPVETKPDEGFQARVYDWMAKCFMRPDSMLPVQRSFRFTEEALELAQASGTSREEVLRLVDYVYGRPPGVIGQEIGGVMVTLSGLATSFGLSMEYAGNAELARCEMNTERIRAKDLAKPQRSPLPGFSEKAPVKQIDCGNPVMVGTDWYGPCTQQSGHDGECTRTQNGSV